MRRESAKPRVFGAALLLIILAAVPALAHQPRLVGDKPSIEVRKPMVISASRREDIPAFRAAWFIGRAA
jgi:hypothetical protein